MRKIKLFLSKLIKTFSKRREFSELLLEEKGKKTYLNYLFLLKEKLQIVQTEIAQLI
ncbi:hypothetical protein BMS3Bbin16_01212 [archaeon BMS3Bbin16]|nr:hypothetical protein BMS3Bbin16_01212 [archaeon BMS3Bbin16]